MKAVKVIVGAGLVVAAVAFVSVYKKNSEAERKAQREEQVERFFDMFREFDLSQKDDFKAVKQIMRGNSPWIVKNGSLQAPPDTSGYNQLEKWAQELEVSAPEMVSIIQDWYVDYNELVLKFSIMYSENEQEANQERVAQLKYLEKRTEQLLKEGRISQREAADLRSKAQQASASCVASGSASGSGVGVSP